MPPCLRPSTLPSSGFKLQRVAGSRQKAGVRTEARFRGSKRWWREFEPRPAPDSEVVTILSADGTITQIPNLPHKFQQLERLSLRKARPPMPTTAEQALCIGSVFTISATNGDVSRKINYFGYCQSTEMLFEMVEDVVVSRGGEVCETERQLKSGLQECLRMTVAVPMLWGVPPEMERLELGIKSGGGIIEKKYREWYIY